MRTVSKPRIPDSGKGRARFTAKYATVLSAVERLPLRLWGQAERSQVLAA
jgi:hypothetical protein